MIAFLNGTYAGRSAQAAFVEVGGVGYQVLMSQLALSKLPVDIPIPSPSPAEKLP